MAETLSLTLANRVNDVPRLLERFGAFAARAGLADEQIFQVTVALDEATTNVIRHAFDDDAPRDILVTIAIEAGIVTVVLVDPGRAFDPLSVPEADLSAPLEHRPIGGLGVHLMRSLARSLEYRRDANRNVLTMTFGPR